MTTPNDAHALAAAILNRMKHLNPARTPRPDPETTRAWAAIIATWPPAPPAVYEQAANRIGTQPSDGRVFSIGDLRKEVNTILDEPQWRHLAEQRRQQAIEVRDQQIRDGTFAKHRGIPAKPRPPLTRSTPTLAITQIREILKNRPVSPTDERKNNA